MANGNDIWIITKEEREKHDAQFNLLNPVNDLVSGDKVRPVLMKSGLPISVLGHIWNLADLDGDGSLSRLEYSVAIHLIRHKLRGSSLPLTLPNSLKLDPYKSPSSPPKPIPPAQPVIDQQQQHQRLQQPQQIKQQTPQQPLQQVPQQMQIRLQQPAQQRQCQQHQQMYQQQNPIQSRQQPIQPQKPIQPQPIQTQQHQQMYQQQQPIQPQQQPIQPQQQPIQPHQQPVQPQQQPVQPQQQPIQQQPIQQQLPPQQRAPSVAAIAKPIQTANVSSQQKSRATPNPVQKQPAPADIQPTVTTTPQSPEWVVSQGQIEKYRIVFKKIDTTNRGHLTGLEARTVLSKSGLPNKSLAQIWALSDIDDDGCLNEEEFCLAMYFIEQCRAGQPIPSTMPPECIPPSYRKSKQPNRPPPPSPKKPLPQKPPQPNLVHHTPPAQPKHVKQQQLPQQQVPPVQVPQVQQTQSVPQKIPPRLPPQVATQPPLQPSFQSPQIPSPQSFQSPQIPSPQSFQSPQIPPPQHIPPVTSFQQVETPQQIDSGFHGFQDDPFGMSPMQVENIAPKEEEETMNDMIQQQWQNQLQQPLAPEEIIAYRVVSEVMSTLPRMVVEAGAWPEPTDQVRIESQESPATSSDDEDDEGEEEKRKELEKQKRFEMEIEKQKELDRKRKEEAELKQKQETERKAKEEAERLKREEIERQKKEEFERQKKEEFERYRLAELEKHRLAEIEKQRQLEREKEEQRRKAQELKEAQMLEQQRQRQLDWEHQRRDQLILLKAREQNQVDNIEKEIDRLKKTVAGHEKKMTELESKLTKARSALNEFTTTIDGMRSKRDQKMAEMEESSVKMEEKKRKLKLIDQEAQLLQTQLSLVDSHLGDAYKMVQNNSKRKQMVVNKLNEQLKKNEKEIENRVQLLETRNARLAQLRQQMTEMHDDVRNLQESLKNKKLMWDANKQTSQTSFKEPRQMQEVDLSDRVEGWTPYLVVYDFAARSSDELTLRPGDVVWVNPKSVGAEAGWLKGRLKDAEGCFPEAYVQQVKDSLSRASETVVVVKNTVSEVSAAPHKAECVKVEDEGDLYVSLYDYSSDEPGDLTFKQGEVIKVIGRQGDWWEGHIGSTKAGLFPANFVGKMNPQPQQPSAPVAPKKIGTNPKMTVMKKPEIATVIASYEASGPEQLTLQPGHLIQVRKKTETGWWEGELQVRGQQRRIGWFPSSYVKLLGGTRHSADNLNEGRSNAPKIPVAPAPEKMQALYDFTSDRDDELSFKQGDIITVISKTHLDWWNGELDGAQGIFPANFVGPYKSN